MLTIEEGKRYLGIMPAVAGDAMGAKLVSFYPGIPQPSAGRVPISCNPRPGNVRPKVQFAVDSPLEGFEPSVPREGNYATRLPPTEAEIDLRFASGIPPTDGYCKVAVSGTDDRNDVRVELQIYRTKPIIPGTTTPIIQLARTVQGY
jgi:hypothetical protein